MFLMDYPTHHPLPYHFLTRDIICFLLSTRNLLIHVRNLANIWVHNFISTRSDFLMLLWFLANCPTPSPRFEHLLTIHVHLLLLARNSDVYIL